MDIPVVSAEPDHIEGMTDSHIKAFPGEFMTLLGPGFVRCFYRYFMSKEGGICLAAIDPESDRVAGLVVGGDPALRSGFMRKHALRVVLTALGKSFVHSRVRARCLEHLGAALSKIARKLHIGSSKSGPPAPEDPPGTWSNLLSICTHPEFQGHGVGGALMGAFRSESRQRGYETMRLSVHNDNDAAIALYKRSGWTPILTTPKGTYFKRSVKET